MGEVKLDIDQIQAYTKQVRNNFVNLHFKNEKEFEQSELNKLIVKQIMNAVALGQSEINLSFISFDKHTVDIIERYFRHLGFEARFINVVNNNTVVFEGMEDLDDFKEDILRQTIGDEVFDMLTEEEKDEFFSKVDKTMNKIIDSIPKVENKLELRIGWDGTFYEMEKKHSELQSVREMLEDSGTISLLDDLENLQDSLKFLEDNDDEDEDDF